ncbi:glycosyltransferase [Prolixibacteraceae bacterium Z1-6]|uniref:Glycosyltransferase n=1 Tax=Draconibacterium aestuarii TaxID=2998507 RepID=A0A9X3F503_9BACT|nr:glycosyltransferase [Prolixibacteraceae bacterium Z1-6]
MLSINIPVYNIEVVGLVKQLVAQADKLQINYEVRVYDDGSDEIIKSINRYLLKVPNVVYIELEKNLGRAAIRNKMGLESLYELLLFMDADSKVVSDNYLRTYIEKFERRSVMCGGRSYNKVKPANPEKVFHWTYGNKREAISAKTRMNGKGVFFMSNNFLMEKKVFDKLQFREELRQYGHEDTLFGFDLVNAGYPIVHIDNPLEHTGLESAQVFLKKSRLALDNLKIINEELIENRVAFNKQVNFNRKYNRITKLVPIRFLCFLFRKYKEKLELNLQGEKPCLFFFDLYKLGYYTHITTNC